MSLFILGSVSRITSNIVLQLAKNRQYKAITISDPLPCYSYHQRFYRLQRDIDNAQYGLELNLQRPTMINDLKKSESYDDVLYVTHDYYESVVSKLKFMETFAEVCRKRSYVYYATPAEYDQYGYANPEHKYSQAQDKVMQINPKSTIIRSDIQDKTQTLAYFNTPKTTLLEKHAFDSKFHFSPQIVKASEYANIVCQVMANRVQGKKILVRGKEAKDAIYGDFQANMDKEDYEHAKENIVRLAQKYNSVNFNGYEEYKGDIGTTRNQEVQTEK